MTLHETYPTITEAAQIITHNTLSSPERVNREKVRGTKWIDMILQGRDLVAIEKWLGTLPPEQLEAVCIGTPEVRYQLLETAPPRTVELLDRFRNQVNE